MAPEGVATTIGWSSNLRTLRHVIERRTDPAAEEETRAVLAMVFEIVKTRYPDIFADYTTETVDGLPWVKTQHGKV